MRDFTGVWQWWVLGVMGWVWLFGSGCGEVDACDRIDCGPGAECVDGVCVEVDTGDCDPACEEGELCHQQRCVAEEGGCDYHGQDCRRSDSMQWDDDYLCLDWRSGVGDDAVCSADCRTQPCPDGSECFLLETGMSTGCSADGDCGEEEVCFQGQCLVAACRPSECDATRGSEGCRIGERCDRIGAGPGTDLCIPEGNREPGESCMMPTDIYEQQQFSQGCVEGSVCVGGICRSYCEGDQCPGEKEECHPRSLGAGLGQVDVCAPTCDLDDEDSCGDEEFCAPTVNGSGKCQPIGDVPDFESCTVGQQDCQEGSICAEVESGESLGRCLPTCDLSTGGVQEDGGMSAEGQSARDDTCPQPDPGAGIWLMGYLAPAADPVDLYIGGNSEPVAEVEGGALADFDGDEFFEMTGPGTISWEVREAGSASTDVPIAEGEFYLDSGDARMLILTAVPGQDREFEAELVDLDGYDDRALWVQGIADLEPADLWFAEEDEQAQLLVEDIRYGQAVSAELEDGIYEVWTVPHGQEADAERLLEFDEWEFGGQESIIAFGGTVDNRDIHSPTLSTLADEPLPPVDAEAGLRLSCRAVNNGRVGACMERCDDGGELESGRCQGEDMGCGPRFHEEREQWTSVCQPVGSLEDGEPCNPDASQACGEGLYCEIIGDGADDWSEVNQRGRCAPICTVDDGAGCPDERGCRPIEGAVDYDIGECRVVCEPDGDYSDPDCPSGLQSCLPEAQLVPSVDGMADVEALEPMCWASGLSEIGDQCTPGNCVPGSECLFERSQQPGFVESMLSAYIPAPGASPRCRPICDPFTDEGSNHQCPDGETCLFNYPWNANAGHCADIEEELSIGDPCDSPGLSCGEDSICVLDGGTSQCVRFCQFTGPQGSNYEQSTCPMGHECRPLIQDIGVCD